jgi:hypothetical protein
MKGPMTAANDAVDTLVGEVVFIMISDVGSGALIELGEPRRLSRPIKNDKLSDVQRLYEGSRSVLIQCGWQLEAPDEADWPPAEAMTKVQTLALLDRLIGMRIEQAEVTRPELDLKLRFDTGACLLIQPGAGDGNGTYTIRIEDHYWTFHADGRVSQYSREGADRSSATD